MEHHHYHNHFLADTGTEAELEDYLDAYERAADRLDMDRDTKEIHRLQDILPSIDDEPFRMENGVPPDQMIHFPLDDTAWKPVEENDPILAYARYSGEQGEIRLFYENLGTPEYYLEAEGIEEVRDVLEEETGKPLYQTDGGLWDNLQRSIEDALERGYGLN